MTHKDTDKIIADLTDLQTEWGNSFTADGIRMAKEIVENAPTADVVPKSEEGAECPTCHGTGRIGTTDWLTKNISKKQLAEEKAKAIAEHEQYIKTEVAREIFEEIESEILGAIKSNVKAIDERQTKINAYEDSFIVRCYGKIDALRGIDGFIEELKEKYNAE